MSDISSRVNAIIVDKLGVDENEVVPSASFTNDLGADSLDTVELIMEFEREFDIQIPDDQAEKIATVGQAIQYIESSIFVANNYNSNQSYRILLAVNDSPAMKKTVKYGVSNFMSILKFRLVSS